MTDTIEDYCDDIESRTDEILNDAESYSDEVVSQAREFRDAAFEIRNNAEAVNEKYSKLRDKYDEGNDEIEQCYEALERMMTIEEQHEKTRSTTRRSVLAGAAAVLLGGAAGTKYLAGRLEGESGLQVRQWYSFGEIEDCLSSSQEELLEENIDSPLDETSYRFERSGDSRSEGWDIYLADSHGQEEFAKLEGQDIYCDVN